MGNRLSTFSFFFLRSVHEETNTLCTANRGVSVRVTRATEHAGKGWFEDRRPASNCDPYNVCGMLAKTCIHDGKEMPAPKKEAKSS